MLNSQAQSPLADALASILRAQLRATSDALAASVRGWSMWTQMLKARPAMDEQPMARSFESTLWSMSWPMNRPLPGLLEGGTCDVARFGFVAFPAIWWAALAHACWAPSAAVRAGKAGLVPQPIFALPPAVLAGGPDPAFSAGRDASFASYRTAGGHALAQVIVKPSEELAQATARAWLSPLEAMLGLWRAALGV